MKNEKFITTTDEQTAETLKQLGYTLLSFSANRWTFINDVVATFDKKENVNYTDVLTF